MNMMSERPLPARAVEQVVGEILIRELARIIGEAEGSLARSREEALATLQKMEEVKAAFRDEAARRDYERAKAPAASVATALGYHPSPDPEVRQQLYAEAFAALRNTHDFERRLEAGDTVEASAKRAGISPQIIHEARQRRKGGGITVEMAFDAAIDFKYAGSRDNQNHARALKRVALDFWGNVPLVSLSEDDLVELLLFARRLPADHGRKHGNNRYVKDRPMPDKRLEVELADARDAELRADLERLDLPDREREAVLREKLVPRLAMKTLKKYHSFMRAAFIAAKDHLDFAGPVMPVVFSTFQARAKVAAQREAAAGQALAQRSRQRMSWSDERLTKLFTSPIYAGSRPKRRHLSGTTIVRDAIYWIPLIMVTAGLRPEEALQLAKSDVVRRNGVLAFRIGNSKTDSSERFVPVPELLLKLGFAEWVNEQRDLPGRFLFPEVAEVDTQSRLSEIFGGRFTSIRKGLHIADEAEDVYALRRTCNSRLHTAGVPHTDCQALLGHKHSDVTNLHYTDRNLGKLKEFVDRIDYRLQIEMSPELGFPVIVGCRLAERPGVDIVMDLDAHGYPRRVGWVADDERVSEDIAPMRSWPGFGGGSEDGGGTAPQAAARLAGRLGDRAPRFRSKDELMAWEYLMSLV
jgi:integrase